MSRQIGVIFRKEMIDLLRDKRTLFAMVILPVALYPILMLGFGFFTNIQMNKLKKRTIHVAVSGAQYAPALLDSLRQDDKIQVQSAGPDYLELLKNGDIQAAIDIPDTFDLAFDVKKSVSIRLYVDLARDRSRTARDRIRDIIDTYNDQMVENRLNETGLPRAFMYPVQTEQENVASAQKMGSFMLGRILPFILILMMINGAFYPAVDMTAGEKERGTLATILVSPALRMNIVIGKFLAVFTACMIVVISNLVSMFLTLSYLASSLFDNNNPQMAQIQFSPTLSMLLLILLLALPLAIFFSAMMLGLATMARSFKEAQNYVGPMIIVVSQLPVLALLPGVDLEFPWLFVPITNISLLMRDVLLGEVNGFYLTLTVLSTFAFAWLGLLFAKKMFDSEDILFNAGESVSFNWRSWFHPPGVWKAYPTPGQAITLMMIGIMLIFYVGAPLQQWDLYIGLFITLVFLIFGTTIAMTYLGGTHWKTTLSIQRPPMLAMILPFLIIPSLLIVIAQLFYWQNAVYPMPEELEQMFKTLFGQPETGWDYLWMLVLMAVLPGICEETMFRGYALSGLRQRLSSFQAIFMVALVFGIFHMSPYRLMPTTAIGLVLGYLTVRTGSIFPAMLAHFLNNAMVLILPAIPIFNKQTWLIENAPVPLPWFLGSVVVLIISLWLVPRGPDRD